MTLLLETMKDRTTHSQLQKTSTTTPNVFFNHITILQNYQEVKTMNTYINLKYKFNGRSDTHVDCIGLLERWSKDHHWNIIWSDGKPIEHDWYIKHPKRILKFLMKHFDKINDYNRLTCGDICYFVIQGEGHIGIYQEYGKLLTMSIPTNELSRTCIYKEQFWLPYLVCGFRIKEEYNGNTND
jgi:hypothetical protein